MEQGKIDIIVGGQFGDEGKGSISAWFAMNKKYKAAVRVGGYNAEHRFSHNGKVYTGRVLPCAFINKSIKLYLGAGHLFSIDALKEESLRNGVPASRITIDSNTGIVTKKHMGQSENADRSKRGGTTGRGAGKAAVHKVMRDGTFKVASKYASLAKMYKIGDISGKIRKDLLGGKDILVEGSQGAFLSVDHGYYPYCCAKNVTPAGVLAEVGAGISDVREIIAVYRAFPMRVPGHSGPSLGKELPWSKVEKKAGKLSEDEKRQTLSDGSKGGYERMFEWNWEEFRKSLILCSPTQMVLTFADWICTDDKGVNKQAHLHFSVRERINRMEEIAFEVLGRNVKVTLIKTGPNEDDIVVKG